MNKSRKIGTSALLIGNHFDIVKYMQISFQNKLDSEGLHMYCLYTSKRNFVLSCLPKFEKLHWCSKNKWVSSEDLFCYNHTRSFVSTEVKMNFQHRQDPTEIIGLNENESIQKNTLRKYMIAYFLLGHIWWYSVFSPHFVLKNQCWHCSEYQVESQDWIQISHVNSKCTHCTITISHEKDFKN